MTYPTESQVWERVMAQARTVPPRTFIQYPKYQLPHPRDAGARVSVGLPRGQIADYRFPPDHRCRGLHVQEFDGCWEIHVDEVHPECGALDHLRRDAPGAWTCLGAAVGGLLGAALGRSKGAAAIGAGLGALLARSSSRDAGETRERPRPEH